MTSFSMNPVLAERTSLATRTVLTTVQGQPVSALVTEATLFAEEQIIAAFREALEHVLQAATRPDPARHPTMALFSPRERDVALLLVQGLSQAAIARRLYLSPHTVKNHTTAVYRAAGVRTRTELAALLLGGRRATPEGWSGSAQT